ncbi:sugar ABC transporter ATP-binding protein [Rhizobium laguerreae]|uniref:sugar ABC transporter ATP-binding protein n=1 Tax=Rhizobium laguerreae TaxID=1076926 RepID=UPI001C921049|nr:sugar ABC transporter ATP-binding protein [Rhizobium laguerreae]MBY3259690.1 sugar ABC transporter ATP-binding protein [Rhizobium laguerreae]MBY3287332.1 sugar ABC transporter ATP-binding protein [Rhizobium laguerreae]MBY3294024.1 sugar ABC transporter ATP-binding protein [Rhizobium laguerreae]
MVNRTNGQSPHLKAVPKGEPAVLLTMAGISKSYPGVKALSDVGLQVRAGEILSLVGENGAGKSTMMKILAGAVKPDAGTISIDGKPVELSNTSIAHRMGISTIYQELMLVPHLSVVENLFLGNLVRNRWGLLDWKGMRVRAVEIMRDLGYTGSIDVAIRDLSVAEQQLVEIGKAITRPCRLLIMDEPTAPLNREEVEHFFKIVRKLQKAGTSIIFITHHLNEIFEVCDRVVVLRDGQMVGESDVAHLSESQLVEMMLGRKLSLEKREWDRGVAPDADVVLEVDGLSTEELLKNVSFKLLKGEVLGLAGLMGSGRTEILRNIFGVDKPSAGTIRAEGKPAMFSGPRQALEGGIGLGPEDRKNDGLILSMPIRHNVTLSSLVRYAGPVALRRGREVAAVKDLCRRLQVKYSSTEMPVGKLSGGNQQKVILARLLDAKVDILLLDEPTRGIDVGAKGAIFELIRQLAANGASVIIVSSVIEELVHVCDRIVCLNLGRVTGEQARAQFDLAEIMINVMGGHSEAPPVLVGDAR